jgi:hypothetical protein
MDSYDEAADTDKAKYPMIAVAQPGNLLASDKELVSLRIIVIPH